MTDTAPEPTPESTTDAPEPVEPVADPDPTRKLIQGITRLEESN